MAELQSALDLSDADLEALESFQTPELEPRYWRGQMAEVPSTVDMDDLLPQALAALEALVDPDWLESQRAFDYRFDEAARGCPLELVGARRLSNGQRPQRFAEMLLVARDYLGGHPDLDIYCASWAVPEVVLLGSTLDEIPHLGEEASRKLAELPKMPDLDVTSTIFELLVGVAALRQGRRIQMLPASKVTKSPDFRVHDLAVPTTIECKRRQGLFDYELDEAVAARAVYDALCSARGGTLAGWIFDVEFSVPLPSVAVSEVVGAAQAAAQAGEAQIGPWGTVAARELPQVVELAATTRLYAPGLLNDVFGWDFHSQHWDGLICSTAKGADAIVERVHEAGALRWRSSSEEALLKKARGVTSLYGKAVQQIPVGEMGIIYICYDEGARSDLADARTREIMAACRKWYYKGVKVIPLIVVSRLYHCPKTIGAPDLTENVMPMFAGDDDSEAQASLLRTFPTLVFTPQA